MQARDEHPDAIPGIVFGPGEGTVGSVPRVDTRFWSRRFLTGAAETGGAYALFEDTINPGAVGWAHVHHFGEEAFFIIEGEFTFLLGDQTYPAPVGSFIFIPRGTVHGFRNDGDRPARFLTLASPLEFAQGAQEFSKLIAAGVTLDSAEMRAHRAKFPRSTEPVERSGWSRP